MNTIDSYKEQYPLFVLDFTRDIVFMETPEGVSLIQWNTRLGTAPNGTAPKLVDFPLTEKTSAYAVEQGQKYVASFFPDYQQRLMLALASIGTSEQKTKLAAIYNWIMQLLQSAEADPINFNPSSQPPYSWNDL